MNSNFKLTVPVVGVAEGGGVVSLDSVGIPVSRYSTALSGLL